MPFSSQLGMHRLHLLRQRYRSAFRAWMTAVEVERRRRSEPCSPANPDDKERTGADVEAASTAYSAARDELAEEMLNK